MGFTLAFLSQAAPCLGFLSDHLDLKQQVLGALDWLARVHPARRRCASQRSGAGQGQRFTRGGRTHELVVELQDALGHATERLQARDEAGVLGHVSDRYRSGSLTKPAIREQLHALFGVYDSLRAKVQIDEVRAVGEEAWVYSTGEVSGRVRGLGLWMLIFSWKREPEIARREQGVWRLYGDQK